MELPKSTAQQEAEARSFDILRYKLARNVGIFRNQTHSDYGIDFEIELISQGQATGRTIKAQVKSSKSFTPRADGAVTVGGIKQTTLAYWCSVSAHMNVVAFAVALDTETIYMAPDVFWQASALIDGGNQSKSLTFSTRGPKTDDFALVHTIVAFIRPTIPAITNAHRVALRGLKKYIELLQSAFHYDYTSTLHEPDQFTELLEVCGTLLWAELDRLWPDARDRQHWDQPAYWDQRAMEDGLGELCYLTIQPVVSKLVAALIDELRRMRDRVLAGRYYWANIDPSYLRRVYEVAIPDETDRHSLRDWLSDYERHHQTDVGDYFVYQASQPVTKKEKRDTA